MPCQSDYLAASGQELESKRVAELVIFLYGQVDKEVPSWIIAAAKDYYGNTRRLDEMTAILCAECRLLPTSKKDKIIYNGKDKQSRKLADWWDRHQEWDARRVKEEKESRRKIMLKDRAIQKLTVEEREALGL